MCEKKDLEKLKDAQSRGKDRKEKFIEHEKVKEILGLR